jgi:deoxyribodipyrimidine photolyase-related protein
MKTLRIVLHDQLSFSLPSLIDLDCQNDLILMMELEQECTYVKHHKKKLVFILSAMRHFAQELQLKNYPLFYVKLDDPDNTGTLVDEVQRIAAIVQPDTIVFTWPGEYRLLEQIEGLKTLLSIPVEVKEDTRFLATREEFASWASGRKELRMEYFYRLMRQKYNILMEGSEPVGGQWNYDAENRKFPKEQLVIPQHYQQSPDLIVQEVSKLIAERFADHFGVIEPFFFALTRTQALEALRLFINQRLKFFGDYQDAMIQDEPWMYHSHLSFYLNIGLLEPLECIDAAENSYRSGSASLNAVEGFIRQILGWREYIRGIYWLKMPEYKNLNFFEAKQALPDFFWTTETSMNCLKQAITETKNNAYAHHIQRLMVLGNFALLAGLDPIQVQEWYLLVYADAYEWVELPNVVGMILFADGGVLASKPYAASGAYINKMSNYCKGCVYDVESKNGSKACPFNYLYWNFLSRHRSILKNNRRLSMIYATLDKMPQERLDLIHEDAQKFLEALPVGGSYGA